MRFQLAILLCLLLGGCSSSAMTTMIFDLGTFIAEAAAPTPAEDKGGA